MTKFHRPNVECWKNSVQCLIYINMCKAHLLPKTQELTNEKMKISDFKLS